MALRLALAQINTIVGDFEANKSKIAAAILRARSCQADIIAFPELAVTGYPPEDLLLKDHFVDQNLASLKQIAKLAKGLVVVVGFVNRDRKGGLYNSAAIMEGGTVKCVYNKHCLPNYSVFDEKRYFKKGTEAPVFYLNGVPFGVTICEDIWVDEGPVKAEASAGARLIINISSSPYETDKRSERLRLLKRRARENNVWLAYANLVGGQDELVFDGASMVVNPRGRLCAAGQQFAEDLFCVDLPDKARGRKRSKMIELEGNAQKKTPVQVPNPKALDSIEEIYQALVLGTRDYISKNGFQKVVVGLSGGIDSAMVAAIAKEAAGPENVIGISMPSRFNAAETKSDACLLARNLGITFHEVPIENAFQAFLQTLTVPFAGHSFGLAEENLQARIRGTILMAFSNKFGWLVLTTGNKSEMATGYCTLYGDMSGGYAVLKDVLKTTVYELARRVNKMNGSDLIPESIISRAPSAELRYNQTDQDSLPPYPVLDNLLVEYVEKHGSLKQMTRLVKDQELARKVVNLVDKSEYKRRQAPPGVKITPVAFGKDWRLPLTNHYKVY